MSRAIYKLVLTEGQQSFILKAHQIKGDTMNNTKEKLRVSYRFDAETVAILKEVQNIPATEQPLFNNRSMTWLIEYAVNTVYKPIVDAASEPA